MIKISGELLKNRQEKPLKWKIQATLQRIEEWVEYYEGKAYISDSGGKDSTVLRHLARSIYPDIQSVFCNTGLEYPEITAFIKTITNVVTLRPEKPFQQIIKDHGFPVISKENSEKIYQIRHHKSPKTINRRLHGDEKGNGKLPDKWHYMIDAPFEISSKCCDFLKKKPFKKYEKESGNMPIVGTMAGDSRLRGQNYMRHGCNEFDSKRPMSKPMSFWLESDVWEYIKQENLPYSKIYDMGYKFTGCAFCMFGVHMEKEEKNRFQRMKETHPKYWNYCINKLNLRLPLEYMGIPFGDEEQTKF